MQNSSNYENLRTQIMEYFPQCHLDTQANGDIYILGISPPIDMGYDFRIINGEVSCTYNDTTELPSVPPEPIATAPTFALLIAKLKLLNWPKEKVK